MNEQTEHTNADPRLSEAYRAIADERTPRHLNETVLRMAAKANRTPYAAARAWLRPAAWAATIGLCLALVLELTQLPQEALQYDTVPAKPATNERGQANVAPPVEVPATRDRAKLVSTKAAQTETEWRAEKMPAKAAAAPGMLGAGSPDDQEYLCPADVRGSADRWYDCIESLRETTAASRVAAELEHLYAAFPDFVVPTKQ